MSTNTYPNFATVRSWKWIVGLIAILAAVILFILGKLGGYDAAVLFLLGVILV
jgi:hypothetical protein